MNFLIQNLQLKKDPKIIEETFFGIEFSFDINLDDNIIGHCNVLMKNSIQHMKITDHVGNIFTFKPRKQSFVEIEDMGKNFSKLSQCHIEKNSQKSSLDNKDDVPTQHDSNRAANNLTNEDMLVEDNDLEVFSPVTENDNSLPNNNDVSPETVDSSSGKNSQKSLTEINFNGEEQKLNNTEGNLETHYRKMGYIQDKEPRNLTSENEANICNSTEITTSQNNQNFTKEQQSATESESIDRSRGNNFQSVGNNISREKSPTEIKIEDFFDEHSEEEQYTAYVVNSTPSKNPSRNDMDLLPSIGEQEITNNTNAASSDAPSHRRSRTKKRGSVTKMCDCNVCGKSFARNGDLKRHKLSHTDLKPFKCEECGKSFLLKGTLKTHLITHTGIKPFQCEICEKRFYQKHQLKKHIANRHSINTQSFNCNECRKTFKAEKSLLEHVRSFHKGIKFECTDCGKGFTRKSDLRKHENSAHKGIYSFQCELCMRGFSNKSHFNYHQRTSCQNDESQNQKQQNNDNLPSINLHQETDEEYPVIVLDTAR